MRTLTNLYNERPTWLQHAHAALDTAVFAAYGWPTGLPDAYLDHSRSRVAAGTVPQG